MKRPSLNPLIRTCDGSNPCSLCRSDNAICVFGERKKANDKVYPKGRWAGEELKLEPNDHPFTQDLLMRLGALDGTKGERFEENPEALRQDLAHTCWNAKPGIIQRWLRQPSITSCPLTIFV
ncbi:hypothetical protein N7523_001032 [Penicillium sp. IBT 18751x]|nr:hypothetical protein N7523_001032 [Penicillium sp. IBT 18751x]